jgi:hypothetical protein
LYFLFDKKVNEPSAPSSILDKLDTSAFGFPTTSPSKINCLDDLERTEYL